MFIGNQIESIKMALELAQQQQYEGHQYDILVVARDELQRLIDVCVNKIRVDNED